MDCVTKCIKKKDRNKNIIISVYVLQYILPHQLNDISLCQKVKCRYEFCIYENIINVYLIYLKKKHSIQFDNNSWVCPRIRYIDNIETRDSRGSI